MAVSRIPVMLYEGLLQDEPIIKDFIYSPYASEYFMACHRLREELLHKSRIHGKGHIERVLLLGALVCFAEKLSMKETRMVLFACSYHDIGRVDDRKDDLHGRRSAMLIVSKRLTKDVPDFSDMDIRCIQAAICTHSINDSMLPAVADEFGVSEEARELCETVCFCLKDADNLDRVRIGDLDPRHLRHESSRQMVSTAEKLFARFIKRYPSTYSHLAKANPRYQEHRS